MRLSLVPPVHRATLLHYVGANGVEAYRQKTPPNATEIARTTEGVKRVVRVFEVQG